ncbi:hypothetical protein BDV10DRAFT_183991 [Aspergillus recurvatus]
MNTQSPTCSCSYDLYLGITAPIGTLGRHWILMLVDPITRSSNLYWTKPDPNVERGYTRTRNRDMDIRSNPFSDIVLLGTVQAKDVNTFEQVFYGLDVTWNRKFIAMVLLNLVIEGLLESLVARDVLMASWVGGSGWRFLDVWAGDDESTSRSDDVECDGLGEEDAGWTFQASRAFFYGPQVSTALVTIPI